MENKKLNQETRAGGTAPSTHSPAPRFHGRKLSLAIYEAAYDLLCRHRDVEVVAKQMAGLVPPDILREFAEQAEIDLTLPATPEAVTVEPPPVAKSRVRPNRRSGQAPQESIDAGLRLTHSPSIVGSHFIGITKLGAGNRAVEIGVVPKEMNDDERLRWTAILRKRYDIYGNKLTP